VGDLCCGIGVALFFNGSGLSELILANNNQRTADVPVTNHFCKPYAYTSTTLHTSTEPVNHNQRINVATGVATSLESTLKANGD